MAAQQERVVEFQSELKECRRERTELEEARDAWDRGKEEMQRQLQLAIKVRQIESTFWYSLVHVLYTSTRKPQKSRVFSLQDRSDRQKALLEELSSSVDSDLAAKILTLEERLAEAEEERGQLQLRLVEAEEGRRSTSPAEARAREEEVRGRERRMQEMEAEADRMNKGKTMLRM